MCRMMRQGNAGALRPGNDRPLAQGRVEHVA
jgi:hypothetical protein